MKQVNIRIFGRVQGVYFRQSTKNIADELGVSGIVMNEPDGTVFVIARARDESLDSFVEFCKSGPESASVSSIHMEEDETNLRDGFHIIRS